MTFIKTFCLFTIALLLCTEAMAETYRLAYSKKQGVEVFANSLSGDWCREALHLKVIAQDKTLFNKEDFNILMKKRFSPKSWMPVLRLFKVLVQ